MEKILSKEEKEILRSLALYLKSRGLREGDIEVDMEGGDFPSWDSCCSDISYFSNSYNVEIPEIVLPIIGKVWNYVEDHDLYQYPDVDTINYERIEVVIDADRKEIALNRWYSYTTVGGEMVTEWSLEEDSNDELLIQLFDELRNSYPSAKVLTLNYNGSGDSGYVEDYFDGNQSVPKSVEDWCYEKLESLHGGWEINKGSQGYFTFDLKGGTVLLNHSYNSDDSSTDSLFEESFS